jgi:hypothetical protein
MNTYLLAIDDLGEVKIKSFHANSIKDAEDLAINYFNELFEDLEVNSWEDLVFELSNNDVYVSELYDIEEF